MTSSFGVEKIHGECDDDEDDGEDNTVFPGDSLERDRVDKGVEEDTNVGRDLGQGNTAGTELIRPNFGRVGDNKRRAE